MSRCRVVMLAATCIVAAGGGGARAADPQAHPVIVGALRDWPPHYQLNDDGAPTGFAIDIFNAVAARAHLAFRYRLFDTFTDMEDALEEGDIDVIPNFGITPSRQKIVMFTQPVETFAIYLFIRTDTPGIRGLSDLKGRRIGGVRSNAALRVLRDAGFTPTIYADVPAALFDLLSGRIDALAYPESVLRALARQAGVADLIRPVGTPLREVKRAIAVRPGNDALLARLSAAVDDLLRSDEYRRIYVHWHGTDPPFWTVRKVAWAAGLSLGFLLLAVGVWRLRVLAAHNRALRARGAERDAAQAALSESETKYRRIVETSSEGVWLIDDKEITTFVNGRMAEMLGLRPDDMVGRPIRDFVDTDLAGMVERQMRRRRDGIADVYDFRLRHADGHDVHVMMAASPILEDGVYHGALAMVTDTTDRQRLQEQLWQSQKLEALGRLAGGVAHDFNNLLLVINAAVALARRTASQGARASKELSTIADASERARALTAQLLAFSRKQVTAPKRVRPAARVAESGGLLRRILGEDVELSLPDPDDGAEVLIDPGQLDQLVFNMAVNARDAMSDGGRFSIRVENVDADGGGSGPQVLLTFEDDGNGMSKDVQAHIFEPFFTTKAEGVGTGLGLATCYGIVTGAGGRIEFESRPGEGARFRVYLPLAAPGSTEPGASLSADVPSRKLTVLVVEDDPIVRALVASLLADEEHTVLQAPSPARALELCDAHAADLDVLVTDIIMPGMNGRDLGRRARQRIPTLKVLYMSGYADRALSSVDELDEHERFLPKPFNPDELLRMMAVLTSSSARVEGTALRPKA